MNSHVNHIKAIVRTGVNYSIIINAFLGVTTHQEIFQGGRKQVSAIKSFLLYLSMDGKFLASDARAKFYGILQKNSMIRHHCPIPGIAPPPAADAHD